MKLSQNVSRRWLMRLLPLSLVLGALVLNLNAADGDMVPLVLKLPPPAFKGTPKDLQLSSYVEPLSDKPRAPMMVPSGLKNLAKGSKLTSSDKNAKTSDLEKLIDQDKEASDQSIIFL